MTEGMASKLPRSNAIPVRKKGGKCWSATPKLANVAHKAMAPNASNTGSKLLFVLAVKRKSLSDWSLVRGWAFPEVDAAVHCVFVNGCQFIG